LNDSDIPGAYECSDGCFGGQNILGLVEAPEYHWLRRHSRKYDRERLFLALLGDRGSEPRDGTRRRNSHCSHVVITGSIELPSSLVLKPPTTVSAAAYV
jgi:hypothetical protein